MNDLWKRFLVSRGAGFDEFGLAVFAAGAASPGTVISSLGHLALIAVDGHDATTFLQGQLTSDVAALESGAWQWSGYCNAKGRLLGTLRLARAGGRFLAETPTGVALDLATRLRKFVLRAKVAFATDADTACGIGVAGPKAAASLTHWLGHVPPAVGHAESLDGGILIGVGANRWHCHLSPVQASDAWDRLAATATPISTRRWSRFDLEEGVPWIVPETQALFVPQMVDFELLGGVSFSKGCYPGQEIVARSQYLGSVKRRLHVANSAPELAPGTRLANTTHPDQAIGNVVSSAPTGDGSFRVLAVLDLESAAAGTVTTSGGGAPLEGLTRVHAAR
jgi:folate-binding protein YgfZ